MKLELSRQVFSRTALAMVFLFVTFAPHVSRAATVYDFNADTIGQTPDNVTVTAGTFDVQNDVTLGKALRAETQVGVIAGVVFNAFASTTDQSVVWKQSYSSSLARGGFTLRAQSTDTSAANSAGARLGYLFHVYDSGSVYIWKVGSVGYTALWSGSLAKAQPRWYKAIAQGTALGFYYSNDGSTYTLLGSTTDSTYSSGVVQYTAGYGLGVAQDSIDDIVLTNLSAPPDVTPPAVSLTAPTASSTVQGSSITLSATATDAEGVAGVKFYVDGTLQGSEDTTSPYAIFWNSQATTSSTHTAFAVARDTSNNIATSSTVSFVVDNVAPVLSAAAVGTLDTGARLSWLTDEIASSKVAFGLTSAYGTTTSEIDTNPRLIGHVVDIAGLVSCTVYHYQLQGTDAVGNIGTSTTDATFSTTGCPGGVTVASTTNISITTASGGSKSLTHSDITLDVSIPTGSTATTSSFILQLRSVDGTGTLGTPASNLQTVANAAFDVKALIDPTTTLDSFTVPVTIVMHYSANAISGLVESSLRIYHYHAGAWAALDTCAVDTTLKTVTCTTPSFSLFALFGSAPETVSRSRTSGTSIQGQVKSLASMGNFTAAVALAKQWPALFPSTTTTPVVPTGATVRDLTLGSNGEDVRNLQKFLNTSGFPVAANGVGSTGKESTYFGALTRNALATYQKSRGVSPSAGYFGTVTRAQMKNSGLAGLWW